MRKKAIVFIALLLLVAPFEVLGQEAKPKNVILMIGDGMGLAHVSALLQARPDSVLHKFPVVGLVENHPVGEWVTDSAAAATALATGVKVKNGVLSLSGTGQPLKTWFEYSEQAGKKTGMITTCSITHATPAAFYAHVPHRDQNDDIADYLPNSQLDLYFGGGWAYFIPQQAENSMRKDSQDLISILKSKGYVVVLDSNKLSTVGSLQKPVVGFFAKEHLPQADKRSFSSADLTTKALELLQNQNQNGFVMMIEGSQIDWASHQNNAGDLMAELIDFEGAIQVAWTFAQQNPDTLLIVTADHETGGVVLKGDSSAKVAEHIRFNSKDHSATMIPLFATGAGSSPFAGIHQNSEIGKLLIQTVTQE